MTYLDTHKHVRRLVYGAAIIVAVAAAGLMFGWDRVADWLETGAGSFGVDIGAQPKE